MAKINSFSQQRQHRSQSDSSHDGTRARSVWRFTSRDGWCFVIGILIAYLTLGW